MITMKSKVNTEEMLKGWMEFFKDHPNPKQPEIDDEKMMEFIFWYNNVRKQTDSGKTPVEMNDLKKIFFLNPYGEEDDFDDGTAKMIFSTGIYAIDNPEEIIKNLSEMDCFEKESKRGQKTTFLWVRDYPKNHWNPMSQISGAKQILGDIIVEKDKLTINMKISGNLYYSRMLIENKLGKRLKKISVEFMYPMEILKDMDKPPKAKKK